jgi:hypothetical protein
MKSINNATIAQQLLKRRDGTGSMIFRSGAGTADFRSALRKVAEQIYALA